MDQLTALQKFIASLAKRKWGPSDYPLRYREQLPDPEFDARWGTPPRWSVQVVNWWQMGGLGETPEAAFADFQGRFKSFVDAGSKPPRPGRGLRLEYASSAVVERYEPIARDFLRRILDAEYDQSFVSDQSSLYDWLPPNEIEQAVAKIRETYGIDVPDQDRLVISEILEVIASGGAA